nr:mannosyltransferase [uncultured Acidocella sp.]
MIAAGRSLLQARPLLVCCLLALALRLPLAIWGQNFISPDEIAQYLGEAHRLVYGQGPVPWEYQVGLRSWLLPGLLAGPMELAKLAQLSPYAGIVLVRILLCFASLSLVWAGFVWGRMAHGPRGGLIAGGLAALWPDLWLMAPHPLEEALAAYCLVPAACLANLKHSALHVLIGGFLLGLSFALREPLAPAIAIIGIALCGRSVRGWALGLGAAAFPVLLVGGLDWLSWGQPFRSFWLNIALNLALGRGASGLFSPSPPLLYFAGLALDWLWTLPLLLWLAWRGARLAPAAGLAALALILEHSLISHKEFRYIFPALALLVPLAGIGLAGLRRARSVFLVTLLLVSGPLRSPFLSQSLTLSRHAFALYHALAARHPRLVAVEYADTRFMPLAPLFGATAFTTLQGAAQADAIVAAASSPNIPPGFTRLLCVTRDLGAAGPANPRICAWTRTESALPVSGDVPPLQLAFPAAAQPFRIRPP